MRTPPTREKRVHPCDRGRSRRVGRAIGAAARATWYLGKTDHEADECYLASVKCNDFVPAPTLEYCIVGNSVDRPGRIAWGSESDVSAWDLDGPPKGENATDKADACKTWLGNLLADGPLVVGDVHQQADAAGYGIRVMKKARAALDVKSIPQKGTFPPVFYVCLPGQCPTPLCDP